jgi:hypothetical protein
MNLLKCCIRMTYVLVIIVLCAAIVAIQTGKWVVLAFPSVQIEFTPDGIRLPAPPGLYERAVAAAQPDETEGTSSIARLP